MNSNDTFIFIKPAYIHGEQEWTFGKHFFQVDSNIFENSNSPNNNSITNNRKDQSYTCFLTVGLICTVANKSKHEKTPNKQTPSINKKKANDIKKDDIE